MIATSRGTPRPAVASATADSARAAQLRHRIVAVGALVLLAFAASSGYDSWRSYRQTVNDTNRALGNLSKALAEQAEDSLRVADLLLLDTAASYAKDRTTDSGHVNDMLARRAAGLPAIRLVAIADERGNVLFHSRDLTPLAENVADRSYFAFQRSHPSGTVYLSGPLLARLDSRPAVVMSRRLDRPDGSFDGIVLAVLELDHFQRLYRAITLGAGSAINLLGADGTLVVREPAMEQVVGQKFADLTQPEPPGDARVIAGLDSTPRYIGAARVPHYPLLVSVTRTSAAALADWRAETYRDSIATLALLALGVIVIVGLVRQLRWLELGEQALRASEERYALALEGANEGHWDWSLTGGPSFVSQKMKELHARPPESEVSSRDAWMAQIDVHPDDLPRLIAHVQDHLDGRTERYELEYRVRKPGGWRWLMSRGRCLRDAGGVPQRFVGSTIDITARKEAEAEKERLERQLRQAQRLEAMGTLAGGIAHDFNNILGAIIGYGELAQARSATGSTQRRYLDNVMQAAGRARRLVEQILTFSRSGLGDRVPVNVQSVVTETLELLAASLPRGIALVRRLDAGNAAVIGDPTQLHQVVMNLCTNAIHAMQQGGEIEVALDRVEPDQTRKLSHGSIPPAAYLRLCVHDTGTGIAPDVVERIFDPFFTTKNVGEGTGLGLSLVHAIVADLEGVIDVVTAPGVGTTFTVWLPVRGEAPTVEREAAGESVVGRGETILVVDDERALVELAEEALANLGYEPVGFDSSNAAWEAFRADPERFDAVLTDETMPDLVGTDLARRIRELRPDIPVLLMTGFAGANAVERCRKSGIEVLRKPLRSRDLAESLRRVLGG